ncbi:MAG: type IV pilin-like G/H family protein [Spirulinaceae cyanobacterium]
MSNFLRSLSLSRASIFCGLAVSVLSIAGCQSGKEWQGTWQFTEPTTKEEIKIILSPEGKVFVVPPEGQAPEGESVAYEIPLEKVSEETDLPEGTEVINLEEQAKQSEGRTLVASLLQAQQAYYLQNNKFGSSFEELGLQIESETDNFQYEINPQDDKSVMVTAKAKDEALKSYTGAIFVIEVNGESAPVPGICETDEPSDKPPAMPKAPGEDGQIECPEGSTSLRGG